MKATPHSLELQYSLTSEEILTAIERRFRLKVALEGAVAEVHLWNELQALKQRGHILGCEQLDADDKHDFEVKVASYPDPIKIECKTIRNDAYMRQGNLVNYKVEVQKTRNSMSEDGERSRLYNCSRFDILAVCLGKQTRDWKQFLFVSTKRLERHRDFPHKLAVMHRVPLPGQESTFPWYRDLSVLLEEETW